MNALDARQRLRRAAQAVTSDDWDLLRAVAEGYRYKEISTRAKVAPATLRVRVRRLRLALVAPAAIDRVILNATSNGASCASGI